MEVKIVDFTSILSILRMGICIALVMSMLWTPAKEERGRALFTICFAREGAARLIATLCTYVQQ